MKEKLIKIGKDLKSGKMSEEEALHFLGLFSVIKSVCPKCKPDNPPYIISKCYCPICTNEWQTVL